MYWLANRFRVYRFAIDVFPTSGNPVRTTFKLSWDTAFMATISGQFLILLFLREKRLLDSTVIAEHAFSMKGNGREPGK
jgi:hypothetical protein